MRHSAPAPLFLLLATLCATPALAHPHEMGASAADLEAGLPQGPLERARSAGRALGKELMTRLSREIREGGTLQALDVCAEVAPEIAERHSTDRITVRRVSLKVRNPQDAPDDWERAQLLRLEKLHRDDEIPTEIGRLVESEGGGTSLRWLLPIEVSDLCLRCHGNPSSFEPELRAALAEHYPDDRAVGYERGDFRGAISVTIRLEGNETSSNGSL